MSERPADLGFDLQERVPTGPSTWVALAARDPATFVFGHGAHPTYVCDTDRLLARWVRPVGDTLTPARATKALAAHLLAARGIPVWHSGAVRCGDQVVMLAGGTGAGKSTTSAAACRRPPGHEPRQMIAEDLTFLIGLDADDGGGHLGQPANREPQVRLDSEKQLLRVVASTATAVEQAGGDWVSVAPIADLGHALTSLPSAPIPGHAGRQQQLTAESLLPIAGILALDPARRLNQPGLGGVVMPPAAAMHFLIQTSFAYLARPDVLRRCFRWAEQLSRLLPVVELTVPDGLDRLESAFSKHALLPLLRPAGVPELPTGTRVVDGTPTEG